MNECGMAGREREPTTNESLLRRAARSRCQRREGHSTARHRAGGNHTQRDTERERESWRERAAPPAIARVYHTAQHGTQAGRARYPRHHWVPARMTSRRSASATNTLRSTSKSVEEMRRERDERNASLAANRTSPSSTTSTSSSRCATSVAPVSRSASLSLSLSLRLTWPRLAARSSAATSRCATAASVSACLFSVSVPLPVSV